MLFLEEDHYVAEDFIYLLQQMQKAVKSSCDKCNIYSLGTYLKTYNYYSDSKKVLSSQDMNFLSVLKIILNVTERTGILTCRAPSCHFSRVIIEIHSYFTERSSESP